MYIKTYCLYCYIYNLNILKKIDSILSFFKLKLYNLAFIIDGLKIIFNTG